MSGVSTATVIAGVTAAAAVAGTAYTMLTPTGGGSKGAGTPVPDVPPPPKPPKLEDPSIAAAALAQNTASANAMGRASTILTSGSGDASAVTTNKKTLLGS